MRIAIIGAGAMGSVYAGLLAGEAGIAPGQACVFYEDETDETRVFGGGFIDATRREASIEESLGTLLGEGAVA